MNHAFKASSSLQQSICLLGFSHISKHPSSDVSLQGHNCELCWLIGSGILAFSPFLSSSSMESFCKRRALPCIYNYRLFYSAFYWKLSFKPTGNWCWEMMENWTGLFQFQSFKNSMISYLSPSLTYLQILRVLSQRQQEFLFLGGHTEKINYFHLLPAGLSQPK